ncbi:hypothetical protein [Mogibacterium diversum]|uniref:hypothetical protein n=1 Tax=Mogibacterium diversum TaxID=114527 RepID=UPI0028E6B0C7|nr:hypothetical protein [Mogibacterium diversum]
MSRWKSTTTIPSINLNVNQILHKADSIDDTLTYESEQKGFAYVVNKDELLILSTSSGYLRMTYEELETIRKEITGILEEVDRKRW